MTARKPDALVRAEQLLVERWAYEACTVTPKDSDRNRRDRARATAAELWAAWCAWRERLPSSRRPPRHVVGCRQNLLQRLKERGLIRGVKSGGRMVYNGLRPIQDADSHIDPHQWAHVA